MTVTRAGVSRSGAARRRRGGSVLAWVERQLVAAAFAEEGLPGEARRMSEVRETSGDENALARLLGAHGLRMFCGSLSPAALAARR